MCGIVGELRFTSQPIEVDWTALSELMVRRGPDDHGLWSDEDRCTLAFRRLAILDLSPQGHQPMLTEDRRFALVFNGEIYNFEELRKQLRGLGCRFRSSGDSEVVLQALATWGRDALGKFNGMFALGFYDRQQRRLLLARDHVGIKPLYYLTAARGLVFGSQYDQILAHPLARGLGVNPDALGLYLRFAHVPAPFGMIQDTYMLEPGSWLEASADGAIVKGRYYRFPWDQVPDLEGDQALEAVDAALSSAVKRQLVSDVPLGAFLSGGVDSPLVVAKIREVSPDTPLRTFTIGTDDSATDETKDARAYGRALGVEHTVEMVSPDQALALLDDVNSACAEPFGDFSIFPTMLVTRLASREFKVMLSGDGGDELFWGYVQRSAQMITRAPEFARSLRARALRRRTQRLLGQKPEQRDLRWPTIGHWQRQRHTHLPAGWLEKLFPHLPVWPLEYDAYDYAGTDSGQTARWLRYNELEAHLPMVLLKVDRASMYNSLEVRVPLLDLEVLNVAARVGWQSCIDTSSGLGKLPLRHSLQRYVRRQSQNKRGFGIPMGQWLRTSLREVFEDQVIARPDILGVELDNKQIRALYKRHLEGQGDFGWGLWPLLSLCLWADHAQQALASSPGRLNSSHA